MVRTGHFLTCKGQRYIHTHALAPTFATNGCDDDGVPMAQHDAQRL